MKNVWGASHSYMQQDRSVPGTPAWKAVPPFPARSNCFLVEDMETGDDEIKHIILQASEEM